MSFHQTNKLRFRLLSDGAVEWAGHRIVLAVLIIVTPFWLAMGLYLSFPTQWFLTTNLIGTVTVFLVLILVQHSQNRDMTALQAKLDELIRSSDAGNHWIAAEQHTAAVIDEMRTRHHSDTTSRAN
jgi:low affinity Fe/Cu permease